MRWLLALCPLFSRGGTAAGLRARPENQGVNRMGWKLVQLSLSTLTTLYTTTWSSDFFQNYFLLLPYALLEFALFNWQWFHSPLFLFIIGTIQWFPDPQPHSCVPSHMHQLDKLHVQISPGAWTLNMKFPPTVENSCSNIMEPTYFPSQMYC